MTPRNDKGFAILPVVTILALLGAIVVSASAFTRSTVAELKIIQQSITIEGLAQGGLEIAALEMRAAINDGRVSGHINYTQAKAQIEIKWQPEAARVNLNRAPRTLLVSLFVGCGLSDADAERLADRLIAKRQVGDGGAMAASLVHPAQLASFNVTPAVVQTIAKQSTIYSGTGRIDPRFATEETLRLVPGLGPIGLAEILKNRSDALRAPEFSSLQDATPYFTTERPHSFRAKITVRLVDGQLGRFETVVLLHPDDVEPYQLLYWRYAPTEGAGT